MKIDMYSPGYNWLSHLPRATEPNLISGHNTICGQFEIGPCHNLWSI